MINQLLKVIKQNAYRFSEQISIAPPNQVILKYQFQKFIKLSANQINKVISNCEFLQKLPTQLFQNTCEILYQSFFPTRENSEKIPSLLNKLYLEQGQEFSQQSEDIYEKIISIIDFMDQQHIGFLTGDICPETFHELNEQLKITRQKGEYDKDQIKHLLKKALFKKSRLYKLPYWGIKSPSDENPRNLFERQLLLEEESNDLAVQKFQEVFQDLYQMNLAHNLHISQRYIIEWFPELCGEIQREQETCALGIDKGDRQIYGQYLLSIKSERLAVIALTELLKELIGISVKFHGKRDTIGNQYSQISVTKLTREIGIQINKQYIFEGELKTQRIIQKKQQQELESTSEGNDQQKISSKFSKVRKQTEQRLKAKLASRTYTNKAISIPNEPLLKLSQTLIYLMKEKIRIPNIYGLMVPLLVQSYFFENSKKSHVILNINEDFLQKIYQGLRKDNSMHIHLDRSLPTIYPPAPWVDPEVGGYYLRPTNLVRYHQQQPESINYIDLTRLYNVLDIIGSVPWRINQKVYNIAKSLWNEGGGCAQIPRATSNIDTSILEREIKQSSDRQQKSALMKQLKNQRDLHSQRCDFQLKLGVAEAFNGVDRIYFPHNLDFRGRIYPIPPHLNHMGADLSRGLLEFADSKPLGERGIYWLKIHLANKMGKDKLSMEDRINYVESNMDLILRCAADPIKHREWTQFEDCWQTIAVMIDYSQSLRCPDQRAYKSNIHVHQDGSCNGLQHYAALGRDIEGALKVNLAKSEKPGDVYQHVANMVQNRLEQDSLDPKQKFHELAKKLYGHIQRKIVKQTVMTSVYGVTFIGAREQIHRQLRDKDVLSDDDDLQYQASYYLAQITLDSIKNLFDGAHRIKQWLIHCASIISKLDQPVSWITPLGLPVIQPYRASNYADVVSTVLQKITVQESPVDVQINQNLLSFINKLPIQKQKQRSAFPPNFIHSLDSTHLMYTAIECDKNKITFAAVHDSYWTHSSSVDQINILLRDQFVRLHSEPLLEELLASFQRRYPEATFPPIPSRGQFNLSQVKDSVYFFA